MNFDFSVPRQSDSRSAEIATAIPAASWYQRSYSYYRGVTSHFGLLVAKLTGPLMQPLATP
jgi:hypothetical protein